ncbi:N-acetylmuramoyl-L-alanine amidase [Parabacteroides distasonis]|uniref:N-acetylmuramoyl-L-alanine amidase n=1 Tax=Parabacteroides distasonis TaxID=823 RepID=UPI00137E5514|nr:N-acetylmuramoyl-L-alanine amidase [Parabacteroides distasonis]MRY65260.1 N-acetylmuramoyl-L-alanine amidase [Parabacteroides distasonis]
MRTINLIVVHCSATREDKSFTEHDLDVCHRRRGFNGVGYHFYIRKNGDIKSTRPLERIGAHSRGFNRESIGICYEGGLDAHGCPADTRTPEQRAALKLLVHQLLETFPGSRVCGHRDLSPDRNGNGEIEPEEWIKACPCFEVKAEFGVTAARHLNSRPDNNDMCPTRHLVRRS